MVKEILLLSPRFQGTSEDNHGRRAVSRPCPEVAEAPGRALGRQRQRQRQADTQGSLASHPRLISEPQVPVDEPASQNKVHSSEE